MTPIAPHLEAFLRERLPVERGASINTCDSYADAFRLLLEYASECLKVRPSELQLEQLDAPLILDFLKYLETKRHNGQSSRNTRLAAIKSFMHFMEYRAPSALHQIRCVLAIPIKKTESRLVRHLSQEELQSILDAPSLSKPDGVRDRAMLHLCFAAALRFRTCRATSGRRNAPTTSPCADPWQRSAAALPATVEGDDRSPTIMADCPTRGVRSRIVPQCSRSSDDTCGLRIHPAQACNGGDQALPVAGGETGISTCIEAHCGTRHPAGHEGSTKSIALARACQHADDRDLYARGSISKT